MPAILGTTKHNTIASTEPCNIDTKILDTKFLVRFKCWKVLCEARCTISEIRSVNLRL